MANQPIQIHQCKAIFLVGERLPGRVDRRPRVLPLRPLLLSRPVASGLAYLSRSRGVEIRLPQAQAWPASINVMSVSDVKSGGVKL